MENKKRKLSKYSNHKIYDTLTKGYVTASQAAALVATDPTLTVTSNITGEDITNEVIYSAIDSLTRKYVLKTAKREDLIGLLKDTEEFINKQQEATNENS